MVSALIFDFDGLILDTELPEFEGWQEIYREHGCELSLEEWSACIGTAEAVFDPYDALEIRFGRAIDRESIRADRRRRFAERVAIQPVLPGVEAYLADAKRLGMKLGVASSSSRDWVIGHLARLGLIGSFDGVRCLDDVARSKPDPELYLAALDLLGLAPAEAVAFEDSPNGIRSAKRAGLFCVAIPNRMTCGLNLGEADLRLGSLADLPLVDLFAQIDATPRMME